MKFQQIYKLRTLRLANKIKNKREITEQTLSFPHSTKVYRDDCDTILTQSLAIISCIAIFRADLYE